MRVRRVVTTREGGASRAPFEAFNLSVLVGDDPAAVAANRKRLAAGVGLPPERVVWMRQVHSANTATVTAPPDGDLRGVDAMVTDRPGLALAVLAADCVPILLADLDARVLGAAHAGRVGAADGVLPSVLAAMVRLGARPDRVRALLGPAVCGGCYEVPASMRDDVQAALPGSGCTTRKGSPGLDLRAGLRTQLRAHGVVRVDTDPRCTAEDPTLYSHRRDGKTGRMAAVTWLDPS
ncbi:peptidoglycan editing factor PgeF [Pseudonocardia acaciae]|uniref:peptidoglycan editing factor PgeF n=1 Tax=Pseudonocardia acaciae TaxID=551276 RepID=UPI000491F62B|nr:peptidoglycan editing factor PgeF [Pseudonocardia acaciae]